MHPADHDTAGPDAGDTTGSLPVGGSDADGTAVDADIVEEPRPQPKSAYELPSRKNTVLRNMIWALALTVAVVVVVAIAFFGVGNDLDRERLPNTEVDVAASAERAQEVVTYPVAVPEVGEDWTVRSARFTDGQVPRWQLQYTSPVGSLVTVTEEPEIGTALLASMLPGAAVTDEVTIAGAQCEVLSGGTAGGTAQGISCEGEDWGVLVHGDGSRAELETMAEAAVTSIG